MRRIEFWLHTGFAIVLFACTLAFAWVMRQDPVLAQLEARNVRTVAPHDIVLIPGIVALPGAVEPAVRDALARARIVRAAYAVTGFDCDGATCFASVAGFDTPPDPASWTLDQSDGIGMILLQLRDDGTYSGASDDDPAIDALLAAATAPRAQRLRAARTVRASAALTDTATYNFPWQPGTSMVYGSLAVHNGGFISGWKAVDFLSDGNASLNRAPNKLLAAAPGAITYVCDDGVNVAVRIGDLIYAHLLPNNARLRVGESFERGEEIGPLKPGSYSARCGYASQQPQNFHVHLAFPDTGTFAMGGWTLTLSDGIWRRGESTWRAGQWRRNDQETPVPTPVPTPTGDPCLHQPRGDANCDGRIDGVDYSRWLSLDESADFNADGNVNASDYQIWFANRFSLTATGGGRVQSLPALTARLLVTPTAPLPDTTLPLTYTFDVEITVTLAPASPTRTLHYARAEIALPGGVLLLPANSILSSNDALSRVIARSSVAEVNKNGVLLLELGAPGAVQGPGTTQSIKLGRFTVQTRGRSPQTGFMLYGAQFVTSDGVSWPVEYTSVQFAVDPHRTLLTLVRR